MSNETKEAWCAICDEKATFYKTPDDRWACSTCETLQPEDVPLEAEKPQEEVQQEALIDDLDHIRIQLRGPWTNDDLQALAAGMQASADAAKEDGLELLFFAVKKSTAEQARSMGGIVVPFRDRHGRIIPGRALNLQVQGKDKGAPQSLALPAKKIILPGDPQ